MRKPSSKQFHAGIVVVLGACSLALLMLAGCESSPRSSLGAVTQQVSTSQIANSTLNPQSVNVVLITLDTVRADHLHCYGDNKIKTPVIDALARNGVLFERAVTQTPLTGPSHASIFTGENPNVHHVRDTGGFELQPSSVTLSTTLQRSGWDTAGFISAAVLSRQFGFNQGFDKYDDQIPEVVDKNTGELAAARPANVTVDHAVHWLNQQSGKPFFVWLHLYDAHQPYNPPPQFRRQYPNDPYDAEIAFEDQELGRFLDVVRKKSSVGKTLILLLSDHGEGLGQHGEDGHGIFLYDSTVRIAWIMEGPGVPAGVRVQQQAREIDALPTVLNLLAGKASSAIQGTSMVPAFSGKAVPTTYSYEETLYPKINMGWADLRGIHTAHWTYIRAPKPELYDLDKDPGELNNVIAAEPKEFRELEAQLKILSRLGSNNTETVVTQRMDQKTIDQLRSLGYVGGSSDSNVELNGKGADPKDRIGVLKIFEQVTGPSGAKLPPARKIAMLQQAIAQDPTNPYLYSTLAEQYRQTGQNDLAMQTCLSALHHGVRNGVIFSLLGTLYMHQGNSKQAILFLQQGVNMDPLNLERQANLASALRQDGQLDKAEEIFRHVNAIQPNAPAYNGLGTIEISRHKLPAARADFERALQLDPFNMEAEYNLGLYCAQTHDFPCVVTAFKTFLAKASPEYRDEVPQAEYALGMACAETKDIPCVRSSLQAFVVDTPLQYQAMVPQAEYYLGVACARLHDAVCARAAFQAFLAKASPAMQSIVPLAQYNLGMACAQIHDIPCARAAFQAFLSNVPSAYESLVPQAQTNLNSMH
ncbi:MAG: sulfatase-like hydrolase/transferase [Acidobacteriaceae bacterium]